MSLFNDLDTDDFDLDNADYNFDDCDDNSIVDEYDDYIEEKPIIKQQPIIKETPTIIKETPIITEKPIIKEPLKPLKPLKKKDLSYDDILKSMNMTIINGKLVLSNGNNNVIEPTQTNQTKQIKISQQPLPQEIKNSAIYNKYFKTYNDIQPSIEIRRPQTIEEYKKMLLEDRIQRILAKKRIDQIKSKKLLFTRDNAPTISNINVSHPTNLNKLFNFQR